VVELSICGGKYPEILQLIYHQCTEGLTPTIVVIVKWLVKLYDRQRQSFSIQMVMYYIENNDPPIETPKDS
jgi:hypothetical protein